jgi:HSP20 family protein
MTQAAKNVEVYGGTTPTPPLKSFSPSDLSERVDRLYETMAGRAFEIFESNSVQVEESGNELIVQAEVPGFTAKELEVLFEPRRIAITGNRQSKQQCKENKTTCPQSASRNQMLRIVRLPIAIDPDKAETILRDGILELKVSKARPRKLTELAPTGGVEISRDSQPTFPF